MTEMIEMVAKAIQQASFRMIRPGWESLDDAEKEMWRIRARAAIEAMREPTGKMVDAGEDILIGYDAPSWISADIYRALIDCALSSPLSKADETG